MQLLKMRPGEHRCLIYSLAMILNARVEDMIATIGHDGQEVWWPAHPVPHSYRGVHIQEAIDLCLTYGHGLTPIELYPRTASMHSPTDWRLNWSREDCEARYARMLHQRPGILIGRGVSGGHACAWDGKRVYDPNGSTYPLEAFKSLECWILV